jgi:hypothetical protein
MTTSCLKSTSTTFKSSKSKMNGCGYLWIAATRCGSAHLSSQRQRGVERGAITRSFQQLCVCKTYLSYCSGALRMNECPLVKSDGIVQLSIIGMLRRNHECASSGLSVRK